MPRETKWMKNAATGISQFRSIALVVQQEGIEVEWNVFNVCPVVVVGDWSGLFCRGHGTITQSTTPVGNITGVV
jgi:hypothetical protein